MTSVPTKPGQLDGVRLGSLTPLALRIRRAEQRRQFGDSLKASALSPLQAGVSGTARNPIQLRASPLEAISKLLQAGLARKIESDTQSEYDDIAKAMAGERAKALGGLGGEAASQQAAIDAGIDPSVLQSVRESKKLDRVDTGGNIDLIDQSGQTVRTLPKSVAPSIEKIDTGGNVRLVNNDGSPVASFDKTVTPGERLSADTALSGQRNSAEIAAAGRATTERGQDLSAETARTGQESSSQNRSRRDTAGLRKEFRGLQSVKDYESSLPIIESARNAPDTPAGDLQVIYSVGKVLDPNSVVREGELQLTQNATPFVQKIVGKARAEISGQGRLTPQTRKDLVDMLDQRVAGYRDAYTRDFDTYSQYAGEIGAEPGQIVGKRPESAFRPSPAAAANDYSKLSDDEIRNQLKQLGL